jgi:class 3 adenylate cyclase
MTSNGRYATAGIVRPVLSEMVWGRPALDAMITAVLFADLVDSNEVAGRPGEQAAIRRHRTCFRTVREVVATQGGQGIRSLAGGLMAVFASASEALGCAVANQREVGLGGPHVRVGLHVGESIRYQDDYFGMPVVVAKGLCDQAAGGEILASGLVRSVMASRSRYRFKPGGPLKMDGLCEPIETLDVAWIEGA